MSKSVGNHSYRLFKRKIDKKGKRRLYYARILDPETGKIVRTVSTKETSYVRAVHWMDRYFRQEDERAQRETNNVNHITVEDLSRGFWEPSAQYAESRRARGYTVSYGYLEISESYTRNHIIPEYGSRRVADLATGEIDAWIVRLHKEGALAGGTINKILQCLRTLLDVGVQRGCMSDNPAIAVKPVRVIHKKRGVLTNEEVAEFVLPQSELEFSAIFVSTNLWRETWEQREEITVRSKRLPF